MLGLRLHINRIFANVATSEQEGIRSDDDDVDVTSTMVDK